VLAAIAALPAVAAAAPAHADSGPNVSNLAYFSKTPCGSGYQEIDVHTTQFGYLVYVCYK
jgi:hypothetical protein